MQKRVGLAVFAVLAVSALMMGGIWLRQHKQNYAGTVEDRWGIVLPEERRTVYTKEDITGDHGEGTEYHVLQYGEKDNVEKAADWNLGNPPEAAITILAQTDVPAAKQPDLSGEWKWFTAGKASSAYYDRVYLFWDETVRQVYVLESFD